MGKSRIKRREDTAKASKISPRPENPSSYQDEPPAFSLKHIQKSHCLSKCNSDEKKAFADSIFKRKDLSWKNLMNSGSKGLGFEKIKNGLLVTEPACLDGREIIAFRFYGKKPMVGFRERDVFYVLWFDRDCTVYDHGR